MHYYQVANELGSAHAAWNLGYMYQWGEVRPLTHKHIDIPHAAAHATHAHCTPAAVISAAPLACDGLIGA